MTEIKGNTSIEMCEESYAKGLNPSALSRKGTHPQLSGGARPNRHSSRVT